MRCNECEVEIPPAWKAAYKSNICPSCGGAIYSKETEEIYAELKQAMAEMENDPEGLAGWLLSNYHMQKIGDATPTEFYGKQNKQQKLKIADNPVHKFLKNTGIDPNRAQQLRELKKEILGLEDEPENEDVSDDDITGDINDEFVAQAVSTMVPKGGFKNNKLKVDEDNLQDYSLALEETQQSDNEHPALQKERLKRLQKQQQLQLGEVGKIKRT